MTRSDVEHDRTPARVSEQVNRPEVKPSHKLSDIIGMLEYRKVVAASVPWLREVMAKADRDDTILLSKRPGLGIPVSVVVHRTMHQDERRSASVFPVSHGISVHVDQFDAIWQRPCAPH